MQRSWIPGSAGRIAGLAAAALVAVACGGGSPTDPEFDLSDTVSLPGGSALVFQSGESFGEHRGRIEQAVRETLAAASQRIPLSGVTIIVRSSLENVIPELGIGGRADAGTVFMSFDTGSGTWVGAIDTWLRPLLAHEMHHVARIRAVGFYEHLLSALVSEGLADQFAVELTSVSPPMWAVALRGAELELWRERAKAKWFNTEYNHSAWFFGTGNVPRWAGYSIGFAMTGDYLADHPGESAGSLYAEPATSFTEGQ